jgi:hypothetical protein
MGMETYSHAHQKALEYASAELESSDKASKMASIAFAAVSFFDCTAFALRSDVINNLLT